MAKIKKKDDSGTDINDLLIDEINSKFKDTGNLAYYLSDPTISSNVRTFIPTGVTPLDFAIANRPNGGWPVGRISEIMGWEGSGKSLLAAYALSNTQKLGGVAVYIDTESAVSADYLKAIGVNIDKLIYHQLEALEDIFSCVETIIEKVRASDKDKLVTIVVDSIMGATTYKEMEADYEKDGYATDKAIILSKSMRKITGMISKQNICLIFTNQLRQKLNAMFGDNSTTSGGKAIAFHSSVRVKLDAIGNIKPKSKEGDDILGKKTKAKVVKNRLGPPLRTIEYDIYFNSGVDDYGSWLNILKSKGIITTSGAYHTIKFDKIIKFIDPSTGELIDDIMWKFQTKEFAACLSSNENLRQCIYDMMSKVLVLEYKINEDFTMDDVNIEDDSTISE